MLPFLIFVHGVVVHGMMLPFLFSVHDVPPVAGVVPPPRMFPHLFFVHGVVVHGVMLPVAVVLLLSRRQSAIMAACMPSLTSNPPPIPNLLLLLLLGMLLLLLLPLPPPIPNMRMPLLLPLLAMLLLLPLLLPLLLLLLPLLLPLLAMLLLLLLLPLLLPPPIPNMRMPLSHRLRCGDLKYCRSANMLTLGPANTPPVEVSWILHAAPRPPGVAEWCPRKMACRRQTSRSFFLTTFSINTASSAGEFAMTCPASHAKHASAPQSKSV